MDAYLGMLVTLAKLFSGLFIVYGLYLALSALYEISWFMNRMLIRWLVQEMGKKVMKICAVIFGVIFMAVGVIFYLLAVPALNRILESFKISQ